MNIKSNKFNLIFLIFTFSSIYLTGLIVYQDYGLNIDDLYYRNNGDYFYNFVKEFLLGDISTSKFDFKKDINIATPALYEIIVSIICDILKISDPKEIYEVSHLTNFSIFFLSLIFLYNIILTRFKNKLLSILSVLILFLSPRIFSESFYNSRDIFFLSMTVVSIFFVQNYFNKNSFKNLVYCSIFFAVLFSSRIFGIIPVLVLFILIFLMNYDSKKIANITNWHFIFFGLFSFLFLILFSPYLWIDTFKNFIDYFSILIKAPESINVVQLFLGEYSSSTNVSWYYRPIWFLITTPTSIIIFLIPGLYIYSSRFIFRIINLSEDKKNAWRGKNELLDVFIFLFLFLSVYLSCRFNHNQFGGWRHLYFIYPFIIYFVIYGINYSYRILRKIIVIKVITFLIFLNLVYCLIWIKINHPYQYVFFNYVSNKIVKNNFDLDYWGLSNLNSLNYILQNDKRDLIKIATLSFSSLEPSVIMLNKKDKKRVLVTYDLEKSDYLLSNHMQRIRNKTKKYLINYNKFYEISVNNHIINTVYKMK